MRPGPRRLLLAAAPGLALALWALLGAGLFYASLPLGPRGGLGAALAPALQASGAILFGWWLVGAALTGWWAARLHARHVEAPARLADAARLLAGNADAPRPQADGALAGLADAVNRLADQRQTLQTDMARLVAEAQEKVAQERDQLGALMAELRQSVVVCNLDGRILLYNDHARGLFHRVSGGQLAGGAEAIGLGRSIHAVIDRALIEHARETVDRHIARGDTAVSAQFVTTTTTGSLLHVVLAPVRPQAGAISGYVLLLDDITQDYAAQSRRDRRLTELTEASRASLANMGAALDMLDYPDLEPAERDGFHAIVRDEVAAMGQRLAAMTADASQEILTRWPLQEMLGDDLLAAAAQHVLAQTGRVAKVESADDGLWLRLDSFSLIQALGALAESLSGPQGMPSLTLRLAPAATPGWAHLDLVWPLDPAAPAAGGDGGAQAAARDIAERHGGELWLEQDRPAGLSFFRFLLPTASAGPEAEALETRPEFYDFDLFAASDSSRSLDDQLLERLSYTVFDTETTGLNPAQGDEIIQIGALRILNGKMLRGERFDQLVDPGREIPPESIPYHGIRPEMVQGQPRIAAVLPAFHAYAADTVLVGHNVAFDMRFLQMKEAATGLRFDQPVLDTLLLASIAQPHEPSHSLEAIAARLGVEITQRHNALSDALVTAEVFLRLLPLLKARGIVTLGQARAAAEHSYYARLRY
ncbi:exonuclease domain-containing protein [Paracoccus sp. P2]|uniref:DNA-directed DNA polymerase n=1 Tax=Paracoccus pantotrophus TaxID=82367 RepID=A0A1I5HNT7_PARPN|nr:exonuclease domain-containing protein [Paracoccus pantotrophus]MDF3853765.1 exonuclease domain-containing protein [Paracoccus pantotrophus]QFG36531.1 DNA polymerase III subunit epsilon [Paracoccus pantotrophus]QLH16806.1 DNA polymerase III subunit epsilon [Paracoccus pantotrophus]RDD96178.1 DNA polymerase III subunit epsilon [Paracoccus pantotrophus]RKS42875.1 DNA polymerase-3 subunit epsilon [Paracoccus pantotrophus]